MPARQIGQGIIEKLIQTEPGVKMDVATFEAFLAENLTGWEAKRVEPKPTEIWPRKDAVKWRVYRHGTFLGHISALKVGDSLAINFFQVDFEVSVGNEGNPNKGSENLALAMWTGIVTALQRCGALPEKAGTVADEISETHGATGLLQPMASATSSSQIVDRRRALRVFLCHSSGDKPAVRELHHRLLADQIDPWLDEEKLLPGQDWSQEIGKAVRTSDVVIVCLSRGATSKVGFVQKEIKYALDVADEQPEGTIFIIPLKLEECEVPERLRRWQWVDCFDETGYKRLIAALRNRAQSLGTTVPPESFLSQVLRKYEGQRVKAKGNDRKQQFFISKGELHYIDLGAAEVCENSALPYQILNIDEEFILSEAPRGDAYNALQMKAVLSVASSPRNC